MVFSRCSAVFAGCRSVLMNALTQSVVIGPTAALQPQLSDRVVPACRPQAHSHERVVDGTLGCRLRPFSAKSPSWAPRYSQRRTTAFVGASLTWGFLTQEKNDQLRAGLEGTLPRAAFLGQSPRLGMSVAGRRRSVPRLVSIVPLANPTCQRPCSLGH